MVGKRSSPYEEAPSLNKYSISIYNKCRFKKSKIKKKMKT